MQLMPTSVVVGSGIAGLQTVRALLKRGLNVLALEQQTDIGGVWTREYPGFGVQGEPLLACWLEAAPCGQSSKSYALLPTHTHTTHEWWLYCQHFSSEMSILA
jgi:cation diffusion facilitator CzcD-associated flavoprotein CzcO